MTTSAVVYTFLFIHIGVILVVTAYFTLGAALAPRLTERGRARFARRPWLPTLIGLVVSGPWVFAAIACLNIEIGAVKFGGAVLGCLWILLGLIGGAGIAQHVGRGTGDAPVSWIQTVRGGLFITLTWILPLVGWLVVLPLTLAAGVGCLLVGLVPLHAPDHDALASP
ncbi:MAG: hypothetical protein ACYSU7_08920 [Planctomycetota bacterium]|jgi:hypothetical protein